MLSTARWIVRAKPHPRIRLFCFPYAGGGTSTYRRWLNALPADIDVCPVYLPGRENRLAEPCFTHMVPLVEALASALAPYMDVPYAFFGHSLGGLVSFELTRYVREKQRPGPVQLFVAAHRAPQLPLTAAPLRELPEAEFIDALYHMGGTPLAVLQHQELMRLLLPVIRADFAIYETYTYTVEAPLACPIAAFGGEQDHLVSAHALAAWSEQTGSTFTLSILPGDHFFLNNAQDLLLPAIAQDLTTFYSA